MTTKPIIRDRITRGGEKLRRFAWIQCEHCKAVRDIRTSHLKEIKSIACNRCDNIETFKRISEKEALPHLFVARNSFAAPTTR